ncbi:Ig-like domain-containing protein [Amycolatopsis sp. SID8362]|uniref:Ig-like domain-containing protein n=1 Tax=Amycolatopsis sp. SID8362 TaxID=2690346 RepID=UPI001EF27499|nr:Ig-like domain-containing protein [Amycolatopsis sp. SID8362]
MAPAPPVISSPVDGSTTDDSTPTIKGTGEPGATIKVTIDGTPAGTVTVGADGTWTLETTNQLADGQHTVVATQTDPAGNVSTDSQKVAFTVAHEAPGDGTGPGGDGSGGNGEGGDGSAGGTPSTGTATTTGPATGKLPTTGAPVNVVFLVAVGLLALSGGGYLIRRGSRRKGAVETR